MGERESCRTAPCNGLWICRVLGTRFDGAKIREAGFEQPVSNAKASRRTVEGIWGTRTAPRFRPLQRCEWGEMNCVHVCRFNPIG